MRQDSKISCWSNLAIVSYLTYASSDLIASLYRAPMTSARSPGSIAITAAEYDTDFVSPAAGGDEAEQIPKIIHQTYKTNECPPVWKDAQQSIKDMHPDYEYISWTDKTARDFIATHYNWFLATFDSYKHPIMRADAIRYFVLFHYGGIYIDMDNGTKQPSDPSRKAAVFLRKTHPTGVSNDIMGSAPGHPSFGELINNLQHYKRNWISPYITVMYSTGPSFVSLVLSQFSRHHGGASDPDRVRILMPSAGPTGMYKPITDFFFTAKGSSWHNDDAQFIMFMSHHWIAFAVFYTFLGFFSSFSSFWIELKLIEYTLSMSLVSYKRIVAPHAASESPDGTVRSSRWAYFSCPSTASSYVRKNSHDFGSRQDSVTALLGNFDNFEKIDAADMV